MKNKLKEYIKSITLADPEGKVNKTSILVLANLIVFLVLFSAIYWEVIISTIRGWFGLQGFHGLLIFGISLYITWLKRNKLLNGVVSPNIIWGGFITLFGCILFIIGNFSSVLLAEQVSLIIVILGIILLVFGNYFFKELFLPVFYLLFMFPLFEEILSFFSGYFQIIGVYIGSNLLKLYGIPVFVNDLVIKLPHISLEVAKVCSGINHITALISLSIPLAYITRKSTIGMVFLVAITFIVGIVSNGLRIALIGVWTLYNDSSTIHGPFSLLYASTIFMFIFAIIVFIAVSTGKSYIKESIDKSKKTSVEIKNNIQFLIKMKKIWIGTLILLLTGYYINFLNPTPIFIDSFKNAIPTEISGWQGYDVDKLDERIDNSGADFEIKRIYTNSKGKSIKLFIGYFALQEQDKEVVSYKYDWLHERANAFQIKDHNHQNISIKKTKYVTNNDWKNALFWYQIGNFHTVDRHHAKIFTLFNALISRKTNGAIYIILLDKVEYEKEEQSLNNFISEIARTTQFNNNNS